MQIPVSTAVDIMARLAATHRGDGLRSLTERVTAALEAADRDVDPAMFVAQFHFALEPFARPFHYRKTLVTAAGALP